MQIRFIPAGTLLFFLVLSGACSHPLTEPVASQGVLDVRRHDFERAPVVALKGEWDFYPQRLLGPADFARGGLAGDVSAGTSGRSQSSRLSRVAVPHEWLVSTDERGAPLPVFGYGTYRLRIQLPAHPDGPIRYALRVPEQGTASRIFVDGRMIASNGTVGVRADEHIPELRPLLVAFRPDSDNIELIVQISNYTHRNGGLWLPLSLGPEEALRSERSGERDSEIFLCGTLFILGVYHLIFFSLRRRDRAALHFGLFCLIVALRVLTTGDHYLAQTFPWWGYPVHHRLEYLSFYLALPTFTLYVRSAFPLETPRYALGAMVIASLMFVLLVLVTEPYVYTHSLPAFQLMTVACGACAVGIGVLGVARRRAGAWLFLTGWLFFFSGILHDIAVANSLFYNVYMTAHAVLLFVFAQAAMLALRFAGAFRRSEELRDELGRAERRYRGIFEQAAEGVFLFENDGSIIAANRAFAGILGLPPNASAGDIFAYFAADEQMFRAALARDEVHDFECRLQGSDRIVDAAISARRLPAGESGAEEGRPRFQGMLQDISERRRAEEMRIARDSAEAANRSKSRFLANMSHEIRTPMNAILGMGDLLAENPPEAQREKFLNILRGAGRTLLVLIDDILDIAKIEAGRLELETAPFEIVEVVESTVEMLAVQAHGRRIELSHRVAGFDQQIPGGLSGRLLGDSTRLRQILVNLIGNAIKFTPEGGSVAIELIGRPDGAGRCRIECSVRDTGVGIPGDRLQAIFDAFSQADNSTTRRFGGSGLGLAISRRLVELMGGSIHAESEPGQGSIFVFTAGFAFAPDAATGETDERVALDGVRILIVDDMEFNRVTFQEILTGSGARCESVAGGEAALQALRSAAQAGRAFDLALIDYHMPGMNGLELARAMRDDSEELVRDTALLAVTSDTLGETVDGFQTVGVRGHLFKPVRRTQLLVAVAAAIDCGRPEGPAGGGGGPGGVVTRPGAPAGRAAQPLTELAAPADGGRWRILMAEDNEDNQTLIRAYLQRLPIELTIAPDGRSALDRFRQNEYDLVLMDMQMPDMDGYEATRAFRRYETQRSDAGRSRTPIIALTAHAMSDEVERILQIGCDAHLAKPVTKRGLIETIVRHTQQARPAKRL